MLEIWNLLDTYIFTSEKYTFKRLFWQLCMLKYFSVLRGNTDFFFTRPRNTSIYATYKSLCSGVFCFPLPMQVHQKFPFIVSLHHLTSKMSIIFRVALFILGETEASEDSSTFQSSDIPVSSCHLCLQPECQ